MTLIYAVSVIPVIFFNSPLFSQTYDERMKKSGGTVPEILDVFTFFMQPIFHMEKEAKLCSIPLSPCTFLIEPE